MTIPLFSATGRILLCGNKLSTTCCPLRCHPNRVGLLTFRYQRTENSVIADWECRSSLIIGGHLSVWFATLYVNNNTGGGGFDNPTLPTVVASGVCDVNGRMRTDDFTSGTWIESIDRQEYQTATVYEISAVGCFKTPPSPGTVLPWSVFFG